MSDRERSHPEAFEIKSVRLRPYPMFTRRPCFGRFPRDAIDKGSYKLAPLGLDTGIRSWYTVVCVLEVDQLETACEALL
jgi:hypothetical protein